MKTTSHWPKCKINLNETEKVFFFFCNNHETTYDWNTKNKSFQMSSYNPNLRITKWLSYILQTRRWTNGGRLTARGWEVEYWDYWLSEWRLLSLPNCDSGRLFTGDVEVEEQENKIRASGIELIGTSAGYFDFHIF